MPSTLGAGSAFTGLTPRPAALKKRRQAVLDASERRICSGSGRRMRIALIGSRWFGAQMFRLLGEKGHDLSVIGLEEEDQLTTAARAAGVPLVVLGRPRRVVAADIPDAVDVVLAAHAHSFITAEARAKATKAAIGYHPSLLPRHRGIAAVEWTMKRRDPIAGGSVYHLSDGMDEGPIAAQEWCFVYPDDDAGSLWRRALAPMGLRLLMRVIGDIETRGHADAVEQDPKAVTYAPALAAAQA
jgi:methionyl-tRNA formyltransferase